MAIDTPGLIHSEDADPALHRAGLDAVERVELAQLPTPLQFLPRLTELVGGPKLWVKRDDCTGLAFGGNKARKLEYLLRKAQVDQAEIVITFGALQSNHARMTAAACAMLGIECHLVLEVPATASGARYERSGNRLLDGLLGATVHVAPSGGAKQVTDDLVRGFAGRHVMIMPPGGSDALGALGYVRAAMEMSAQAEAIDLQIDRVMLATGSGGTGGGLLAGFAALEVRPRLLAIALAHDPLAAERILGCARGAIDLAGLNVSVDEADFDVCRDYIGEGYSAVTPDVVSAISQVARAEGLFFDPVYTGKMLVAMFDLAKRGFFAEGENVVLLHSGGTPAIFAFDELENG